ncbi:DUF4190 domain-containing protein [Actinosynnema sp. NPDC047251]|uniref:DUF4190 domain-containing protein n=1 Tax=Saccharothrix espanaensis (strain ATCC 51144 / DSM 44229 / JCM 9112 / NBRC 15066 / NRRL 15764) TaxID=1179773 RepID=K0JVJ9_SACES|nr:DUF4190 domain-containing protein [Saccharothrix espanaensis]CCH28223.1 hypothetical protein BN6_08940 [Saccharothrix espanaensis DSM 44229]
MAYYPQGGYYPPPKRTNGMAIAALICAFVFAPAGIVLGIIARNQIKRTGEDGRGLATAGLVLGVVFTLLGLIAVILWIVAVYWIVKNGNDIYTTYTFTT